MSTDEPTNRPLSKTSTKGPSEQFMHERRVAELLSRLLSHYWTSADPPAARQLQIEDWIEDLVEFSDEAVEAACRGWRQSETRRPTPAEIRSLTVMAEERIRTAKYKALPPPELTRADVEEKCRNLYGGCLERLTRVGKICFTETCRPQVVLALNARNVEEAREILANMKEFNQ
jgi:hypothetical protein